MMLREYLPLEQGLRLHYSNNLVKFCRLREYLPLEHGLRILFVVVIVFTYLTLRDYLPL